MISSLLKYGHSFYKHKYKLTLQQTCKHLNGNKGIMKPQYGYTWWQDLLLGYHNIFQCYRLIILRHIVKQIKISNI